MNAAFLLVTSAWLTTGQATNPPPAAPAVVPHAAIAAAPAGCGAGCGGDCNACCDSCCDSGKGGGLLGRFRGLFSKKSSCCDSCDTCGSSCGASCGASCTASCGDCCDDGCGKRKMGGRLRGLFSKKGGDCCDSCGCDSGCGGCGAGCGAAGPGGAIAPIGPVPEQIKAPKEPAKPMPGNPPATKGTTGKEVQIITPDAPKAALSIETETKSPFELSRRYESRVAHAPDYSAVTGQLFFVHADGGLWVLRYAPLWQEDAYGGSIVLARDIPMDRYREGDLVTVKGEVLSRKSSVFLGGALYRAKAIELVDREAK